jgi:hopanoid biosynthesis associated protein HpnK
LTASAASRLVITADDFGADLAVNEAVEIAHRRGVLTAASLMVNGPAADDAVARARRLPGLGVGLHLVLVDGRPILPADKVPHLVDRAGCFRTDMARAGATMFFHPAARREVEAEIAAQFQAFADTGLTLDHVNAHKHFQLHPTIAAAILEVGARHSLKFARAPYEPSRVLDLIEPGAGDLASAPMRIMATALRDRFRRAGVAAPDQVFGLRWSGSMTPGRLKSLVERLPAGLSEIYLHPAVADAYPGSAAGYRYADELAALLAPEVVAALDSAQIARGSFLATEAAAWS